MKPSYKGNVTKKLASAPTKATQRTVRAWSSRPKASSSTPKAIGIQIARLNKPIIFLPLYLLNQTKYVISTNSPRIMTRA